MAEKNDRDRWGFAIPFCKLIVVCTCFINQKLFLITNNFVGRSFEPHILPGLFYINIADDRYCC